MNPIRLIALIFTVISGPALGAPSLDDMFKAVKSNDVRELRTYLDQGMDPNSTNQQGYSVLMEASREGHVEAVAAPAGPEGEGEPAQRGRRNRADASGVSGQPRGRSAPAHAGRGDQQPGLDGASLRGVPGQAGVSRYLLDNKAEVDARAPNGITPLMAAVRTATPTS